MKVAVLFSGGKDSCLALYKAMDKHEVVCLISLISENDESYMFHVPNIKLVDMQAKAVGLPLIKQETKGEKEKELEDLKKAIVKAKKEFGIEGVVTGAIKSVYQSSRIQKICNEFGLNCFNPLWLKDEIELLNEIVDNSFEVIISGVFAEPLGKEFLGRIIDRNIIGKLKQFQTEHKINPSGEGGELESTVLDAPFFKKKIKILDYEISYEKNFGTFKIKKAELVEK